MWFGISTKDTMGGYLSTTTNQIDQVNEANQVNQVNQVNQAGQHGTLDWEAHEYFTNPTYRKTRGDLHVFKKYIVDNNLQQGFLKSTMCSMYATNPLLQLIKNYLNSDDNRSIGGSSVKHIDHPRVKLIWNAFDEETNSFHKIITPEFLLNTLTKESDLHTDGIKHIFYDENILYFFNTNYPKGEKILIWIFQNTKLNPNMVIENTSHFWRNQSIIGNASRCKYLKLLNLLLDNGAKLFSDSRGYLLAAESSCDKNQVPHYEDAHNFAIEYYIEKGDKEMVKKLSEVIVGKIVPQMV